MRNIYTVVWFPRNPLIFEHYEKSLLCNQIFLTSWKEYSLHLICTYSSIYMITIYKMILELLLYEIIFLCNTIISTFTWRVLSQDISPLCKLLSMKQEKRSNIFLVNIPFNFSFKVQCIASVPKFWNG